MIPSKAGQGWRASIGDISAVAVHRVSRLLTTRLVPACRMLHDRGSMWLLRRGLQEAGLGK